MFCSRTEACLPDGRDCFLFGGSGYDVTFTTSWVFGRVAEAGLQFVPLYGVLANDCFRESARTTASNFEWYQTLDNIAGQVQSQNHHAFQSRMPHYKRVRK
jgi:hypothetical protein